MKPRFLCAIVFGLALSAAASAQDAYPGGSAVQNPAPVTGPGGRPGWRGGVTGWTTETGMGGRGVAGTVTAVAADHYTIKSEAGEVFTVYFSINTRIFKQSAEMRPRGGGGRGAMGAGAGANPPQALKSTDIKVGDEVAALGEVDPKARSVGAVTVLQIDPERARQMREMRGDFGKTWLMGKVTAIDGVKLTLLGSIDNSAHTLAADENTTFRKRREPITLADVQVGDVIRVEGAVKDGTFAAAAINVMGMPPGGTPTVPRDAPPASPSPQPTN